MAQPLATSGLEPNYIKGSCASFSPKPKLKLLVQTWLERGGAQSPPPYTHTHTHTLSQATDKQEFSGFHCTEGNWYKQLYPVSSGWIAISGRFWEEGKGEDGCKALSCPQASRPEKTSKENAKAVPPLELWTLQWLSTWSSLPLLPGNEVTAWTLTHPGEEESRLGGVRDRNLQLLPEANCKQ